MCEYQVEAPRQDVSESVYRELYLSYCVTVAHVFRPGSWRELGFGDDALVDVARSREVLLEAGLRVEADRKLGEVDKQDVERTGGCAAASVGGRVSEESGSCCDGGQWTGSDGLGGDKHVGAVDVGEGVVTLSGDDCESTGVETKGGGFGVGLKTLLNRQRRKKARERKVRKKLEQESARSGESVVSGRDVVAGFGRGNVVQTRALHDSVQEKWRLQNELVALKTKRELEVLKSNDVDLEKRRYRTQMSAQVERNMVSIEKAHALLAASGNVPFHGSAETVVSDVPSLGLSGETVGSISPNSSASQAEFRAAQKTILDQEHQIELMHKAFKKIGYSFEDADAIDKCTFTDDTNGNELMDRLYPDGVGIHMVLRDGKTKFKVGGQDF